MGGKILSVVMECEREKRRKAQETTDMVISSPSLDYWRAFLGSATVDIFQVIENSIHIASQDHPAEFSGRCNQLIKRFTDYPQRKNEEEVMRINDLLTANWKEQTEDLIFESLRTLQLMELSVEVLKDTKIENIIKCLQKHPIKRIKHLAKLLINRWKLLEDVHVNTAEKPKTYDSLTVNSFLAKEEGWVSFLSALPVPEENACLQVTKSPGFNRTASTLHSQTEHIDKEKDVVRQVPSPVKPDKSYKKGANPQDVPRNPVTVTSLPSGFQQEKKCNDQPFEARLETTERKLQEAYQKEKLAKKQRCNKLIEVKDFSKKDHHHEITDMTSPVKPCRSYKRATNPQDVDQSFEVRLEVTKRKLQDAYLKEKIAKKQRSIKVIEIEDLPKKDRHHEITDRRCSSKKWTNCKARHPIC